MNLTTGISRTVQDPFIATEQNIRKIVAIMENALRKKASPNKINIHIEIGEDQILQINSLDELFSFENTKNKYIKSIDLITKIEKGKEADSANPEDNNTKSKVETTCAVKLYKEKNSTSGYYIYYGVTSPDRDWCLLLIDELEEQIDRIKKKRILKEFNDSFIDAFFSIGFLVAIGCITALIDLHHKKSISIDDIAKLTDGQKLEQISIKLLVTDSSSAYVSMVMLISFLLFILMIEFKPIAKIRNYFSKSWFSWGEMKTVCELRLSLYSNIKWIVVIGFAVALIAGICTEYLNKLF